MGYVPVRVDADTDGVVVATSKAAKVAGRIIFEGGTPEQGPPMPPNADGTFTIGPVRAGEYIVAAITGMSMRNYSTRPHGPTSRRTSRRSDTGSSSSKTTSTQSICQLRSFDSERRCWTPIVAWVGHCVRRHSSFRWVARGDFGIGRMSAVRAVRLLAWSSGAAACGSIGERMADRFVPMNLAHPPAALAARTECFRRSQERPRVEIQHRSVFDEVSELLLRGKRGVE
jgi:hypothetical protein